MSSDVSQMLDTARETMSEALDALRKSTSSIIAKLNDADDYDEKLGSHLAWVTGKVSEITSSLRQLEKHDRLMSRTPEQRFALVCDYIRNELDPARRLKLADLLGGLEQERRVLS